MCLWLQDYKDESCYLAYGRPCTQHRIEDSHDQNGGLQKAPQRWINPPFLSCPSHILKESWGLSQNTSLCQTERLSIHREDHVGGECTQSTVQCICDVLAKSSDK